MTSIYLKSHVSTETLKMSLSLLKHPASHNSSSSESDSSSFSISGYKRSNSSDDECFYDAIDAVDNEFVSIINKLNNSSNSNSTNETSPTASSNGYEDDDDEDDDLDDSSQFFYDTTTCRQSTESINDLDIPTESVISQTEYLDAKRVEQVINGKTVEEKNDDEVSEDEDDCEDAELETAWSFWIDRCVRGTTKNEYEAGLKLIHTVDTVQVFIFRKKIEIILNFI